MAKNFWLKYQKTFLQSNPDIWYANVIRDISESDALNTMTGKMIVDIFAHIYHI